VPTAPEPVGAGWRPPAGDLAVAAGFAALGVLITLGIADRGRIGAALALTVAHSAALAWRRRHPEAVLGVMGATAVATAAAGWPVVILGPAALAGVHGLGATRDRQRAVPLLVATVAVMAATVSASTTGTDTIVGNGVAFGVAWWLGDRQRRLRHEVVAAERDAEARARRAVSDERLAIARELHDVVAHALSVIAVQAGTGRVVAAGDPAAATGALATIETESRRALDEMRRLLAVLRDDDSSAPGPLAPSPGLDDLEALVAVTVRSGLPVEVHIDGNRAPLPAGAELAAFRIVQEALTNVRRHAGASRAEVRVAWNPGAVDVEVLDDGRGRRPGSDGNGLVGMRERAALYGGSVEAGNRPGGGFRVAAHIPGGERG
jgi:signal transduction histidine kinase